MAGDFIRLNGYAITFNQCGWYNGAAEFADRRAFDQQLESGHADVFLNFGSHDAEPIARPLTLFADSYGLGFSISVSAKQWRYIGAAICRTHQFCSVNFANMERERDQLADGRPAWRISDAVIDHVTLVDSRAVYRGTGVWPAHEIDNDAMPFRLRQLAARWSVGWNNHVAQKRKNVAAAAQHRGRNPFVPSESVAARMGRYAEMRKKAAMAFAAGGSLPVLCHVAFTKGGGFDESEFMQMVAAAHGRGRRR